MSLFTTTTAVPVHGVFGIAVPPPAAVVPDGVGLAVLVAQLPWGPPEAFTIPASSVEFNRMFAPAGMSRTGSAYLATIRKAYPLLGAVRVVGADAVVAIAHLAAAGGATVLNVPAKYPGAAGNLIQVTTGPASDGDANHVNLTASVTSGNQATSETYPNVNVSGVGTAALPDTSASALLGTCTTPLAGIPVAGTVTMATGSNGTVDASRYVGTPGGSDAGFALLESDSLIDHVFTDDPGNTLRTTVNLGLVAHVLLTTDRLGYVNGPTGQTAAMAQTDAAQYRSTNIVYVDPWVYITDDGAGARWLVPGAPFAASVCSQLAPSTSPAWKSDTVSNMLQGIVGLEFDRGSNRGLNTAAGIMTLIKRSGKKGGYAFEAGKVTSLTSGQTNITRTRVMTYAMKGIVDALQPFVDAPNIAVVQDDEIAAITIFLAQLKKNASASDVMFRPYISDFAVLPSSLTNSQADIDNGTFTIGIQMKIGSSQERIFVAQQAGETVQIRAAA